MEQLANIGSEIGRAAKWQEKDKESYKAAYGRALELLDLTIDDSRWRGRLKEIARVRELVAGAALGENLYNTSFSDLERYFSHFALAARLQR